MNLIQVKKSISNLEMMTYKSEPVVTTQQLSEFYDSPETNMASNFSRNKSRFKEGRHFFKVSGSDLKDLRITFSDLQISPKARSVMLWTERGSLNHAKMVESDQAWDVFDTLVDCYFWRKKNQGKNKLDSRVIGIEQRHFETDAIKMYVDYCIDDGMDKKKAAMYFSTITNATYKALDLKGMGRNEMTAGQLIHLSTSERLIGESLESSMLNNIPCRECYYIAKDQLTAYSNIAISKTPVSVKFSENESAQ